MKVSVIIPTYNRPGYLAQAVHSVLQQTHPVYEIIIVDDGSSSKHRPRIDALKQLDSRISVFHFPENKGASAARNYGLEKSGGNYILFLDDDDLLHPHMVESNLRIFTADKGAGVVSSGFDIFFDTTAPDADWSNEKQYTPSPEATICSWDYGDTSLLEERPFSALLHKGLQVSSSLISRQTIGSARFQEDLTRGEDNFFWLVLANTGCSFKFNHTQLGFYRLHRNNSLSAPNWRKAALESRLKLFREAMVTESQDRLALHLSIARILLQFDRFESFKHILSACRILVSFPMIPFWPLILKSIPARFYNRWHHRKVHKAFNAIIAGKA